MSPTRRPFRWLAPGVSLVILLAQTPGRTEPGSSPAALSAFFDRGVVFQDRNGDGAVDFVEARFVLPEHPSASELAAAADVAARLGFETSAMDLPLDRTANGAAQG